MLILDRRKPFFPGIHPGAYPLGLIGAYVFGETGSGSGTTRFYDSASTQRIPYLFNGSALNLKNIQSGGGFVDYNNSSGGYSIKGVTRAYDPKTWFTRACCRASTTGGLISKNDENSVNAGWMHSIDSAAGVDFAIEHASVNLHVRAANAGVGPWTENIHSFAFTWDGTVTAANQHIYIDGIEQAHSVNTNGSGIHGSDGTNALVVDGPRAGAQFGGNGVTESFFLFNRRLTTAEIQELFINPYRYYVPQMDVMLKSAANQFTQALNASMSTFSGSLNRQTNKNLTASMATFSGLLGLAHHLFLVALPAMMRQMAGALVKQAGKALNASMSTFAATLGVVKIKSGNAKTFNASMATMAGTLVRQTDKNLNANMSRFNATLALAVRHEIPPPTCIPAGCTTIPTIISHVEQCDEQGS